MEILKPNELSDRIYTVELQNIEVVEINEKPAVRILWLMLDEYRKDDYLSQIMFINTNFGIKKTKEFLKSLNSEIIVYYENLEQFKYLVQQILERTKNSEYKLEQYTTKSGWIDHKIINKTYYR